MTNEERIIKIIKDKIEDGEMYIGIEGPDEVHYWNGFIECAEIIKYEMQLLLIEMENERTEKVPGSPVVRAMLDYMNKRD